MQQKQIQVESLFMGGFTKNYDFLEQMIKQILQQSEKTKNKSKFYNMLSDQNQKDLQSLKASKSQIKQNLMNLLTKFTQKTNPAFSPFHIGHFVKQASIPSIMGSFIGTLNQNNNACYQIGPVTQELQFQCFKYFAKMFGYPAMEDCQQFSKQNDSWGHFTSGGTIANFQALWSIKNIKYLPMSLKLLILNNKKYQFAKIFQIKGIQKQEKLQIQIQSVNQNKKLIQCKYWELLNIPNQVIFKLLDDFLDQLVNHKKSLNQFSNSRAKVYQEFKADLKMFNIQYLGLIKYNELIKQTQNLKNSSNHNKNCPIIICSGVKHFSIPKSFSALGMGQINIKNIQLNKDNHMNMTSLKTTLQECLIKKIPVLTIIAVIGSTQFSSVDDLCEILKLRNVFSKQGLYFSIHCDAALGGYFRSIIQVGSQLNPQSKHYVNSFSEFVAKQYVALSQADSITFDPHKSGYSVMGSGAIIYKNHKMTNFINFSSAYILNHDSELNMTIYGLQGSRSGALVASVYASIKSIPLNRLGHGTILEKCLMKTKIFFCKLQCFGQRYPQFTAITSSRTYTEKHNLTYDETQKRTQRNFLAQIASSTTKQITEKLSASKNYFDFQKYYRKSGPDLMIVCYGFNFFYQKYSIKVKNNSLKKYNMLNSALIKKCQANLHMNNIEQRNMYLCRTIISYSKETLKVYHDFLNRAGLIDDLEENQKQIVLVRSTFFNPFYLKEDDDGRDIMDMTLERLKQNLKQTYQSLKKDPSF